MAQKDVTIEDILNGGGSSGTKPVQPSTAATPPVDRHLQGVADFGNGEDIKQKKPVTTVEATDPTQAAVNLVEQRRKEQAQRTNIPPVDRHLDGAEGFMNYERAQNGQTPEKSPVFTANVQTTATSPSEATGDGNGNKDKDAAVVSTEPKDGKKATDPTQAAINLVEQHRKEQSQKTPPPASTTGNIANDFMNYLREQNGQTPEKSPVFTDNVQTTTPSTTTSTTNSDGGKEKDAAAVNTEPKETKDGKKKSPMSYADMFAAMEPYKEPTKEQLEKERKKEKRERLFAALGDGISALSNLFFTTQYAPNMYNPKETNSERVDDYWTKLRDEREANRRRYVDGYLKAKQADDLHAIQQQNADVAAEWKKADTERKNAIAKAQGEVLAAKAAKDQNAADLAAKKLEYLMAGWPEEQAKKQAEIDLLKVKKDAADAQAKNAIAAADEHRRRGTASWVSSSGGKGGRSGGKSGKGGVSKSGGEYIAYDKNGNVRHFKAKGAAEQFAREQGTWQTDYSNSTSTKYGITTTTRRPNGGHSVRPKAKKGGGRKGGNWASGLKL